MQVRTETRVGIFVIAAIGIFFYMTFQIGVFRLDRRNYNTYTVYFDDVSGLAKKADVKIAGVKVGWVEAVELLQDQMQAKAHVTVSRKYSLHRDAYAIVRQDGLLGNKYLEVVPGDPLLPSLGSGEPLGKPGKPPVNIDELLHQFKDIATNVEEATESIKHAIGGDVGRKKLKETFDNLNTAADKMASFSESFDRILTNNENNLNLIMTDFKDFTRDLRDGWPSIQQSIERIGDVVDRDFKKFTDSFESTAEALEEASIQARQGFRSFGEVADKINEGRGLIGKLVTEDETYHDIKYAVQGLKNYFAKIERLGIVFDGHGETMWGKAENRVDPNDEDFKLNETKGYFGARIHPSEDYFFLLQGVASQWKTPVRTHRQTVIGANTVLTRPEEDLTLGYDTVLTGSPYTVVVSPDPAIQHITEIQSGGLSLNAQVAGVYGDLAARIGLFESSFGVALDYDIPFDNDDFRWVTSLEMFDLNGFNRINDNSPHLKWLNRLFFGETIYVTFGADDFISKHNTNGFFGLGLRFGDDDAKYLISKVGTGSLTG